MDFSLKTLGKHYNLKFCSLTKDPARLDRSVFYKKDYSYSSSGGGGNDFFPGSSHYSTLSPYEN